MENGQGHIQWQRIVLQVIEVLLRRSYIQDRVFFFYIPEFSHVIAHQQALVCRGNAAFGNIFYLVQPYSYT
ncbi:hypothetical protein D9M68_824040 [compost metagenome]